MMIGGNTEFITGEMIKICVTNLLWLSSKRVRFFRRKAIINMCFLVLKILYRLLYETDCFESFLDLMRVMGHLEGFVFIIDS